MLGMHPEGAMGMSKPRTFEDKMAYAQRIQEDCAKRWADLSQYLEPGTGMNTIESRVAMFIDYLVEWEVITKEQKLDFEIKFAEGIRTQLIELRKQVQDQLDEQKKQQGPKLVMPSTADVAALKNVGKR